MKIVSVSGREILDSNGFPTVEAVLETENGRFSGFAPSGASVGINEATDLKDEEGRFDGKGVKKAVSFINGMISQKIAGRSFDSIRGFDKEILSFDKKEIGGNTAIALSIAATKALASWRGVPLFRYLGEISFNSKFSLPKPMILVLEGGKHGDFATDIQEFMVCPSGKSFMEILEAAKEISLGIERELKRRKYSTGVGMEGAFCPKELKSDEEALKIISSNLLSESRMAVDFASSEFFDGKKYLKKYSPQKWLSRVEQLARKHLLWSLEDPFSQEEWQSWSDLTTMIGDNTLIVGDDLLTTNPLRIKRAIELRAVNAAIIKPNQIGTVSETLEAVKICHDSGLKVIVSHRSGETNDSFIADLAVGVGAQYCKFGALSRGERLAKYNRLLEIEREI